MNQSFKPLFVILAFIGWTAVFAIPPHPHLDQHFSLAIGQSAKIEGTGLEIKFKAVLEDSRCPINAFCTMAGNGRVALEILDPGGLRDTAILNTEEDPKTTTTNGYKLTLISLNPPRIEGKSIAANDYSIMLRVEKIDFRLKKNAH